MKLIFAIIVALTLLVALALSARDTLNSPAASPFHRWGSAVLCGGFIALGIAWFRGASLLAADILLVAGFALIFVSRRRKEAQPNRSFRRRL